MKKGFTLVELLVVLVIIGIIIGLILPNALRAIKEANERECASNLRSIDTAIQLCYTQTRDWDLCDEIDELVTPQGTNVTPYLDETPVCPFGPLYTIIGNTTNGFASDKAAHFTVWPPRGIDHVEK